MSIKQARAAGGKTFREQWGPSLLAVLLGLAGVIVASVAVLGVGGIIVSGPICVGILYVYYQAIQGKKIEYLDMLTGFKTNFGEIVLGVLIKAAFLTGICAAAYGLIATFVVVFAVIPLVWILTAAGIVVVAIVALIIVSLNLAAVEYILMREPEISGWEAVKKSKRIMSGHTGRLFGFDLSFIGWFILTGLFFPLAIFTVPYYLMSRMYFIGAIYDEAERRAKEPVYTAPMGMGAYAANVPMQPEAPQNDIPMKFCKHCGTRIPMEAVFCANCGLPQNEKPAQPLMPSAAPDLSSESASTVDEAALETPSEKADEE